jgi:hypothetical protein
MMRTNATKVNNIEDDFFGNNDNDHENSGDVKKIVNSANDDQFGELCIRDDAAAERQHFVMGYHETYDESHEAELQHGFDDGYRDSYDTALIIGQLLGQHATKVNIETNSLPNNNASSEPSEDQKSLAIVVQRIRERLLSITQTTDANDNSDIDGIAKDDYYVSTEAALANIRFQQQSHQQQQKQQLEDLKQEVAIMLSDDSNMEND